MGVERSVHGLTFLGPMPTRAIYALECSGLVTLKVRVIKGHHTALADESNFCNKSTVTGFAMPLTTRAEKHLLVITDRFFPARSEWVLTCVSYLSLLDPAFDPWRNA